MYDLHLHSTYSDGDTAPAEIARLAAARGLTGISLTDHNGIWGAAEFAAARPRQMTVLEGIELSVREAGTDIHILGYSTSFDRHVFRAGLADTLAGYATRMEEMVGKCQAVGYDGVTAAAVRLLRSGQADPCYLSYDVARVLTREHGLPVAEARALVTGAGVCAVPYGAWALTSTEAVTLIHTAGGAAVWGHPGLVVLDGGEQIFAAVLDRVAAAAIDGLEVYHPYHSSVMTARLARLAAEREWLVTGGSDWHGHGRYGESDKAFGKVGIDEKDYQRMAQRIEDRKVQNEKRKTTT